MKQTKKTVKKQIEQKQTFILNQLVQQLKKSDLNKIYLLLELESKITLLNNK